MSTPATAMESGQVITVSVRNVYGRELVYPADTQAILFARLLDVKSFNAAQIGLIRMLGYAVRVAAGQLPPGFSRPELAPAQTTANP